jgi:hypothetical protein
LETIFGISPDGGSGVTEAAVVLGVALVIGVVLAARRRVLHQRRTK